MKTDEEIKEFLFRLISAVDYDVYKGLHPDICEEPEYAEKRMNSLVQMFKNFTQDKAK